MERNIEDEVRMIEAYVQREQGKQGNEEPEEEIYHVYDVPGGIVILREGQEPGTGNATVIDSIPQTEPDTDIPLPPLPVKTIMPAYVTISTFLLLVISCITFQFYVLINPLDVSITLAAKEQKVSLQGTLQLGRVLNPITVSQSATANTTGHGHQDAKTATGNVTFYNGQQTAQTVPQGTVFTGSDGVSIETTQPATIPPGNPSTGYGTVTVTAQALQAGSKGNIQAGDVNIPIAIAVFVKNEQFSGGQDERDFQAVAKSDIDNTAAPLKTTLDQSMQATLTGQLKNGEAITSQTCTPTTTADHRAGDEATQVKVTVSETCSGIAYNTQELTSKVTQLLTTQAANKLETGYSLLGNPQITVTSATAAKQVMLSFRSVSTWIYALSTQEQQSIKKLIAGKNTQRALQLLHSLPGIESASLQFSGFGDDTRLPKNLSNIHLLIFYGL